jgi:Protein of unknown function (DUF1552)
MKQTIHSPARRRFLEAAGTLGVALPFLQMLHSDEAYAEAGAPKRLICLMAQNGTLPSLWPTATNGQLNLGQLFSPLESMKKDCLFMKTIDINCDLGDQHFQGAGAFWAGTSALLYGGSPGVSGNDRENVCPGRMTVDQHAGRALSAGKKYVSFNVGHRAATWGRFMFATGPNMPVVPEANPNDFYNRVFSQLMSTPASSSFDRRGLEEKAIIDSLAPRFTTLRNRLSGSERTKMDAHLNALDEVKKSLDVTVTSGPACTTPRVPDGIKTNYSNQIVDWGNPNNLPNEFDAWISMIVAGFACDLTRVATFSFGPMVDPTSFPFLGVPEAHHDLSHDPQGNADKIAKINTWYASQIKLLMSRLAAIPEGNGSMLDNTIIALGNELAVGAPHSPQKVPIFIGGGRSLGIKLGTVLDLDAASKRVTTSDLLVTILAALGIPVPSFGDGGARVAGMLV